MALPPGVSRRRSLDFLGRRHQLALAAGTRGGTGDRHTAMRLIRKVLRFPCVKNAPGKPALNYLNAAKDESPKEHPDKTHLFGQEAIPNAF
jgi:hypothetical protein